MARGLSLAILALLAWAPAALAHPLGNFSVNHLSRVSISEDRVDVRYILDQAEIPTFRERRTAPDELARRKAEEIRRGLVLEVDGRVVALEPVAAPELRRLPGQGGLQTTRLELRLRAQVDQPERVVLEDRTYPGRVGWKAIVAVPGEGTAVRSSVPSGDPTDGLRSYPESLLSTPLDQRSARFEVEEGDGTLVAPQAAGGPVRTTQERGSDGFAGVFESAASGETALLFLLFASLAWGALHALSPGHGKAMVAAYLVGTRGTARHAVVLGATVTVTHTIGVFALGLVTLGLSQYILPEDLYPWLGLVSGLLVVLIGAGVLRGRLRAWRAGRTAEYEVAHDHHHHEHDHHHGHDHHHHHDHGGHHHHHHGSGHGHSHEIPDRITPRGLIGMGAAAGLIPCPSALVVLLAAVAQQQLVLGLALIVVFSLGLAGTLTALGLAVVSARSLGPRLRISPRVATAAPAVSAVVIVGAGLALTAQAIPGIV